MQRLDMIRKNIACPVDRVSKDEKSLIVPTSPIESTEEYLPASLSGLSILCDDDLASELP